MATLSDNPSDARVAGTDPPSSKLRWLLTGVCGTLLALLLLSAVLAYHFLGELHAREMAVTRALSERTQMLAGLWLSIQDYNQAVQQFVAQAQDERDDLQRIKGIGPALERTLHRAGVYRYAQIANWTRQDIQAMGERLPGFHDRIVRDRWPTAARRLHLAKYGSPP